MSANETNLSEEFIDNLYESLKKERGDSFEGFFLAVMHKENFTITLRNVDTLPLFCVYKEIEGILRKENVVIEA